MGNCVPLLLIVILGVTTIAGPKWMDRRRVLSWLEACLFCVTLSEFLLINIPDLFSPMHVAIPVFWMICFYCPSILKWRDGEEVRLQVGSGDFFVLSLAVATACTLWILLTKLASSVSVR